MRATILFFLLVVTGCGGVRVPEPPNAAATAPLALARILELHTDVHSIGWATPISQTQLVTAAHMVGAGAGRAIAVDVQGGRHPATLLWQDDDADVAMYRLDADLDEPFVPLCDKPPVPGTLLFWRLYLEPGNARTWTSGRVLGIDSDNEIQIDGFVQPGASGSGAITTDGRLCGVITAGWATTGGGFKDKTVAEQLELLRTRTSFRPVVIATPIAGKFPERGKH